MAQTGLRPIPAHPAAAGLPAQHRARPRSQGFTARNGAAPEVRLPLRGGAGAGIRAGGGGVEL